MSWSKLGYLPFIVAGLLGIFFGLSSFTFSYGEGTSYFSDNPGSCANCHIMQNHLDAWYKSSHSKFATCNDCHLSKHPVLKYVTKADNGFFHSWAFTFQNFHEPIQIKKRNRRVAEANCLRCHSMVVGDLLTRANHGDGNSCLRCHSEVGHAVTR